MVLADVSKTVSVGNTSRLVSVSRDKPRQPPPTTIQGYRIGLRLMRESTTLFKELKDTQVIISNTTYSSNEVTGKKSIVCGRSVGR